MILFVYAFYVVLFVWNTLHLHIWKQRRDGSWSGAWAEVWALCECWECTYLNKSYSYYDIKWALPSSISVACSCTLLLFFNFIMSSPYMNEWIRILKSFWIFCFHFCIWYCWYCYCYCSSSWLPDCLTACWNAWTTMFYENEDIHLISFVCISYYSTPVLPSLWQEQHLYLSFRVWIGHRTWPGWGCAATLMPGLNDIRFHPAYATGTTPEACCGRNVDVQIPLASSESSSQRPDHPHGRRKFFYGISRNWNLRNKYDFSCDSLIFL